MLIYCLIFSFICLGVIQYYTSLLQTLIWLCHVSAIFWTVRFPLSAKYFESKGYFFFVHIGMVIVALVVPVIPVAAVSATGGFTLTRFPPLICFAENVDVTFYGLNLPLCILLATGITLILLIFYTLIGLVQQQVATEVRFDVHLSAVQYMYNIIHLCIWSQHIKAN